MDEELKTHFKTQSTWRRGLYMMLFAVLYGVTEFVVAVVVIFQFLSMLFTGQTNPRLLKLSQNLSSYIYQLVLYLGYNTEEQPYPFSPWPEGPPSQPTSQDTEEATPLTQDDTANRNK